MLWSTSCGAVVLLMVVVQACAQGGVPRDNATTTPAVTTTPVRIDTTTTTTSVSVHTATSSTTTPLLFDICGDVVGCLFYDKICHACLTAINNTVGFPHTVAEFDQLEHATARSFEVAYFHVLSTTDECSPNTLHPTNFIPVLVEMQRSLCFNTFGMVASGCVVASYMCFADINCSQCLSDLYSGNKTKLEAFGTLACASTNAVLLDTVANNCVDASFPSCTYEKLKCHESPGCAPCLDMLTIGNGAGAARACPITSSFGYTMDFIVGGCLQRNAASCSFAHQRCYDVASCNACLASMSNGDSFHDIVTAWSSPSCVAVAADELGITYLYNLANSCVNVSSCRTRVANCMRSVGYTCLQCLNGAAYTNLSAPCSTMLSYYGIPEACAPCPDSVYAINTMTVTTAVVGGLSAPICVAVAVTIVVNERHLVSMRDRIVIGLMFFNAVYSTANTFPINGLHTGTINCGRVVMSFQAIQFGRAWWFFGKYGLVCYELLILGASIKAMTSGLSAFSLRTEAILHVLCVGAATVAFAVFYIICGDIIASGYNIDTENEAFTNTFSHVSITDDVDDATPSIAASSSFRSARKRFDDLVREMLVAWDILVGVTMVLWLVLRLMYRHTLRAMRVKTAEMDNAETMDVWADTRKSAWDARRELLTSRAKLFAEVTKPLEPYIVVFVVFAIPAFVMSTGYCQDRSGAVADDIDVVHYNVAETRITYMMCDTSCELALAFRSIATVCVYLMARDRRVEFVAVRATWRKLRARVAGCFRPAGAQYSPLHDGNMHNDQDDCEMLELADTVPGKDSTAAWKIHEDTVVKVKQIGQGAYGAVWQGTMQPENRPVAIKVLFAGAVDEDGDLIDLNADEEFQKECAALVRINSPHLIKFFGLGTTQGGQGFIVTEFMTRGSLEKNLHDSEVDLTWNTRVSIGLQVALGMEHLHNMRMIHRDLKSANVLLDEDFRARVCDFGLARVVRPVRRQQMVISSFTGTAMLLPSADSIHINNLPHPALESKGGGSGSGCAQWGGGIDGVAGVDPLLSNRMSKAAGTLLWMAPEVFRGDQNYNLSVDVYSYGILLWELATGQVPWSEMQSCEDELLFFEELNHALQTGRRPTIPPEVIKHHSMFVALMERCWEGDPVNRPPFSEVADVLALCMRTSRAPPRPSSP